MLNLNFEDFPFPELACKFLNMIKREVRVTGSIKSPSTVRGYAQAFRKFAEFSGNQVDLAQSFTNVDPRLIDSFEDYLYTIHKTTSNTPFSETSKLIAVLRLGRNDFNISPELSQRLLTGSKRGKQNKNVGREPYSDYVTDQILKAAIKDIEHAKSRMFSDSNTRTNDQIVDLDIDHIANLYKRSLYDNGPIVSKIMDNKLETYINSIIKSKKSTLRRADIDSCVYINTKDVLSFTIAISLLTGLPLESVRELDKYCLKNESPTYCDISYIKERSGTEEILADRFPMGPGWTGPSLVALLLKMTERARKFAPSSEANWLMLGMSRFGMRGKSAIRRLDADGHDCARFCKRHIILDDDGGRMTTLMLARLRKTYKAQRYKATPTTARYAGDHSPHVHDTRYADVEALRQTHHQTVEGAFQLAFDSAINSTIVTNSLDEEESDDSEQAMEDVWMASCKDSRSSPYNPPGSSETCRSPIWGCLTCKNAVISASNLPAICAFLDHVIEMRQCLDLRAWAKRYGYAFGQITANILPAFSAEQISHARNLTAVDAEALWLPAELTKAP